LRLPFAHPGGAAKAAAALIFKTRPGDDAMRSRKLAPVSFVAEVFQQMTAAQSRVIYRASTRKNLVLLVAGLLSVNKLIPLVPSCEEPMLVQDEEASSVLRY